MGSKVASHPYDPYKTCLSNMNVAGGPHGPIKTGVSSVNKWRDMHTASVAGSSPGMSWAASSFHSQLPTSYPTSGFGPSLSASITGPLLSSGQHLLPGPYKAMLPTAQGPSVPGLFAPSQTSLPHMSPPPYSDRENCDCPSGQLAERLGLRKNIHSCHIPSCGKVYSEVSHLKAHLRMHTGQMASECGKRFTNSDEFRWHLLSHMGKKGSTSGSAS